MRSSSASVSQREYASEADFDSTTIAGVRFRIARMSLARRIELTRRVRELARPLEFLAAGESLQEKIEATLLGAQIDRLYLDWALTGVEGLQIDGAAATKETLIEKGPESLCREIVRAIRDECGLSDEERKN
jgi:hypothetical protein